MTTATLTLDRLEIPFDIHRLESFRAWVETLGEDAPRVHFSRGNVWIQMSPQDYLTHLRLVTAITARLTALAKQRNHGEYHGDGGWLTNEPAALSTEPDGFLVLWETFRSGAALLVPRKTGVGSVELVGRADMVLEVISDSSVVKDTVELCREYALASFREYWLVDARSEQISFRLFRLSDGSYDQVPARSDGFVVSPVWGSAFRIERSINPAGQPTYDLLIDPGQGLTQE